MLALIFYPERVEDVEGVEGFPHNFYFQKMHFSIGTFLEVPPHPPQKQNKKRSNIWLSLEKLTM